MSSRIIALALLLRGALSQSCDAETCLDGGICAKCVDCRQNDVGSCAPCWSESFACAPYCEPCWQYPSKPDPHAGDDLKLVRVVLVSRHNIRTPYSNIYSSETDFSAYTALTFPDNNTWGMSDDAFRHQHLTPNGIRNSKLMGAYYKERWGKNGLSLSCDKLAVFADHVGNSPRDVTTGQTFVEGLNGCDASIVQVVDADTNQEMLPVVNHKQDLGCPIATQQQVLGYIGGDLAALDAKYSDEIDMISELLEMPADASVCARANKDYDPTTPCTLAEVGTSWKGSAATGGISNAMTAASYFADAWHFQYLEGIEPWGFGKLTWSQLRRLYELHVDAVDIGANMWTARASSSHQVAYIVASLAQAIEGKAIDGLQQGSDAPAVLLFSHDINIHHLRRLFGLHWVADGFSDNTATLGGALNFELWRNKAGEFFVKTLYICASPEQQRASTPLSPTGTAPSVSTLVLPGCGVELCPWSKFVQLALSEASTDCMAEPLKSKVEELIDEYQPASSGTTAGASVPATVGLTLLSVAFLACVSLCVMRCRRVTTFKSELDYPLL